MTVTNRFVATVTVSLDVDVGVEGEGAWATLSRTYDTLRAESSENASDGTSRGSSTDGDAAGGTSLTSAGA